MKNMKSPITLKPTIKFSPKNILTIIITNSSVQFVVYCTRGTQGATNEKKTTKFERINSCKKRK